MEMIRGRDFKRAKEVNTKIGNNNKKVKSIQQDLDRN